MEGHLEADRQLWRCDGKSTVRRRSRGAGNGGFVDIGTGEVLVAGSTGVGLDLNVNAPFNTFAPRLGIAYQLNPTRQ